MAIVLMKRALDQWQPGEHTGTFRGNQLAFVAATAALELWGQKRFVADLAQRAAKLEQQLRGVVALRPKLKLRGRGFIWAIDFSEAGGPTAAAAASRRAFDKGLLIERCGRDDVALKILPPITIDDEAMRLGCTILSEVV